MPAIRQAVMLALIWSALSVLAVKPAHAFEDGHELLAVADLEESGMKFGFSLYISGVAAGYRTAIVAYQRLPAFCIPEGTLNGDIAETVRRFVRYGSIYGTDSKEAEEFLDLPGSLIVLAALRDRYKCGE